MQIKHVKSAVALGSLVALALVSSATGQSTTKLWTGDPVADRQRLMKLNGAMQRVPDEDLRSAQNMNAFFIVPTSVKESVHTLFLTHPPMDKRIEALQRMESQLQAPIAA